MKIIALGDIHGRSNWKTITAKNDFDKVIFIGDYFDSKENISPSQQLDNFKDLVEFKKANMEKVILLFGNHDYHYLRDTTETYGGFQRLQKLKIQELINKALEENLIQMCCVFGNYLFVHAGVTKTWCKANNINIANIVDSINSLFKNNHTAFKFTIGTSRSTSGDDITQTPIWVRPESLVIDPIDNFVQVVGHTPQKAIQFMNNVILIDTLGTSKEYLLIIDGIAKPTNSL